MSGYLACKSDAVESLLAYPAVANAFCKSNATLPSSAAVERLFSAASQVLCARRCRLKLLINLYFCDRDLSRCDDKVQNYKHLTLLVIKPF